MTDQPQTANFDRADLVTLPFDTAPCKCVKHHCPKPETTERHHIFPKGLQVRAWGRVRDHETVPLCGVAHNNIHRLIDHLLAGGTIDARTNGYHERIARDGYHAYMAALAERQD